MRRVGVDIMTIQELEQKLNECQKALAELKESKKEGKWKPVEKEEYWYRDVDGEIYSDFWSNHIYDEFRYNHAPLFKTKEECEKYWHFVDTVKEKSYEFPLEDWRDKDFDKYEIYYDRNLQEFIILGIDNYKVFGGIYFRTREDAQYIIDNFKEELLKYWI